MMTEVIDAGDHLLIGSGGVRPSVWRYEPKDGRLRRLCELDSGHSVYAADTDPRTGLSAVGTRRGKVVVIGGGRTPDLSFQHGAPILSVCLNGNVGVASAGCDGRCLYWAFDSPDRAPRTLQGRREVVCALRAVGEDRIAGLGADGGLSMWDIEHGALIAETKAPRPGPRLALVRLTPWGSQGILAYPAASGQVGFVRPASGDAAAFDAHRGESYACMATETGELVTVGKDDGLVKCWRDLGGVPAWEAPLLRGIVSGEALTPDGRKLLLAREDGSVHVCEWGPVNVETNRSPQLADVRAIVGPSVSIRREIALRRRSEQAAGLIAEVRESLARDPHEFQEERYKTLDGLGHGLVGMALRAQQKSAQGDLLGEFGVRLDLVKELPWEEPASRDSLLRFAQVLGRLWRFEEACRVLGHLAGYSGANAEAARAGRPGRVMAEESWVAEPEASLGILIEATSRLGKAFVGRWVTERLPALLLPVATVRMEEALEKCGQVVAEQGAELPKPGLEDVWWLTDEAADPRKTVVFEPWATEGGMCRELIVGVCQEGASTLLTPVVCVRVEKPKGGESVRRRNDAVKRFVRRGVDPNERDGWERAIRAFKLALRRLKTTSMASREVWEFAK